MYMPKAHEVTDKETLHDLICHYPLGCLVTLAKDGMTANHIPFLLDPKRGEFGTLVGHVARANPVWHDFSASTESMVIFQGPDTYISPTWYPSKQQTGKVVPTWNYAVVHAHGFLQIHDERDWKLKLVSALTQVHERAQTLPWQVSDAPTEYIDQLLDAIVGIEVPVTRLVGKWKVSQNRPNPDRLGVIAGLQEKNTGNALDSANLVLKSLNE